MPHSDETDSARWSGFAVTWEPTGPIETTHARPWATVKRVPTAAGPVSFKACAPVQAFEQGQPGAICAMARPSRGVYGHDEERAWLLLTDAGEAVGDVGNPPESWLAALPHYAELQNGETDYADDHVRHGVPDLRLAGLPAQFGTSWVRRPLPLTDDEIDTDAWPQRLIRHDVRRARHPWRSQSVQHDDLHMANLYSDHGRFRVLDWGDSCIGHPFASLVETFRFLEERNGLPPDDPWFGRLRDAYLEPWGAGLRDTFSLAMRVGAVAHAVAWLRRDALPQADRPGFDVGYGMVLRRAIAGLR